VPAAEKARPPNIVYVFPDQHRNCSWSLFDPQVQTPNLAALAREGAVFNRCFSNYPLCSPHRAALLTGRYPQATTIMRNLGGGAATLPLTEVTIADVLKKAGYATGYVGKWHLYKGGTGLGAPLVPPGPHRHGFDYWRVCHNYRHRYDTRYYDDHGREVVLPGYAPKCQMDLVLEFIARHADQPFCIFLSWHPPHGPYPEAPRRFQERYAPDRIKLRPNVPPAAADRRVRQDHVGYFAHVSAEDAEMGRLMQQLARLGIADNTIVCFSSDHGDMLGSFNRWGKNVPWEESIHVPFIIRWPAGIPAGRRLDTLFSTVDITPTLLGLAGEAALPRMQGTDLSASLKGQAAAGPESVFIMSGNGADGADDAEAPAKAKKKNGKASRKGPRPHQWRGVRTARFTWAKAGPRGAMTPWLLYDNEKDPLQLHNLITDAGYAQTIRELDGRLATWLQRVGEA